VVAASGLEAVGVETVDRRPFPISRCLIPVTEWAKRRRD
jgi:hypothetical protein